MRTISNSITEDSMKTYTYEDEETAVLDRLIRHADHNRSFNRTYVDKIYEFMLDNEYITEAQLQTLNKICYDNKVRDPYEDE